MNRKRALNIKYKNLGIVHLYKIRCGKLIELTGDLVITENDYFSTVSANFEIKNDAGKIIKVYTCSSIEGDVFNNIVWLYEENRKRAAELLCNNQKKLIKDLKAKIVSYGELADMLEKEMEN